MDTHPMVGVQTLIYEALKGEYWGFKGQIEHLVGYLLFKVQALLKKKPGQLPLEGSHSEPDASRH